LSATLVPTYSFTRGVRSDELVVVNCALAEAGNANASATAAAPMPLLNISPPGEIGEERKLHV
jgi:hypothetical protein